MVNVGPASQTVAQHQANIGETSRVSWDVCNRRNNK